MNAIQSTYASTNTSWALQEKAQAPGSATSFAEIMSRAASGNVSRTQACEARQEAYLSHLRSKYGQVRLESIGRDEKSLRKAAGSMRGSDVVIAPNIFESMAADPEIGGAYERKIDEFFAATPRLKEHFAAKGMTYEPCGVVVHEDGTVTYICGGGDSPERVAEVNRLNARRDADRAKRRRAYFEDSQERIAMERELVAEAQKNSNGASSCWTQSLATLALGHMAAVSAASLADIDLPSGTLLFASQ